MKMWQRLDRLFASMFRKMPGALRFLVSLLPGKRSEAIIPFSRPSKTLSECTVALVTTCGIHPIDVPSFDMESRLGDPTFREYRHDTLKGRGYRVSHSHIDPAAIMKDINAALPIDRMKELEEEGIIGRLNPRIVSFMGFIPVVKPLVKKYAPEAADILARDRVDIVLLTPC